MQQAEMKAIKTKAPAELFSLSARYVIPEGQRVTDLLNDASLFLWETTRVLQSMDAYMSDPLATLAQRLVEMSKGLVDASRERLPEIERQTEGEAP